MISLKTNISREGTRRQDKETLPAERSQKICRQPAPSRARQGKASVITPIGQAAKSSLLAWILLKQQ